MKNKTKFSALILLAGAALLTSCGGGSSSSTGSTTSTSTSTFTSTSTSTSTGTSTSESEPFPGIIEWKEDVTLQVPNGKTWYRKRKLVVGETYYMRRHSGSQSFYISAEYPDGTFLDGYENKFISATTITSWSFCIEKTSWVKFTIRNENSSTGQTSIYWYGY